MGSILTVVLAVSTTFAQLLGAGSWIGTPPSAQSLHGKVVIVDVFTFDCINCQDVVPELRNLRATLPGSQLEIVGIHSPETPYERVRSNVVRSLADQGITWPVAIDNDFVLWRAYAIQSWPTQLIFDRHGRLRKTIIGEGQDPVVAATVRELLSEH